jgi:uncharacterized protein (DUF362 family)
MKSRLNYDVIRKVDERAKSIHRVGLNFEEGLEFLLPLINYENIKETTKVAIIYCSDYDPKKIFKALIRGFELLDLSSEIINNNSILIKPGLVEAKDICDNVTTNPIFLSALIKSLKEINNNCNLQVCEGSGHERDTEYLLQKTGIKEVLKNYDLDFVDLNQEDVLKIDNDDSLVFQSLLLPKIWFETGYRISLAKLKTHHRVALSLGMKNLFGCVPGSIYGWPKNYLHWMSTPRSIVDLTTYLKPNLTIIDGIFGVEGNGPLHGLQKDSHVIIIGSSTACVDMATAQLIGFSPLLIPMFWYALKQKLINKIELVGDTWIELESYKAPSNISWLEGTNFKSIDFQISTLKKLLDEGNYFWDVYKSYK